MYILVIHSVTSLYSYIYMYMYKQSRNNAASCEPVANIPYELIITKHKLIN